MKNYLWHRFIYAVLHVVAGPFVKLIFGYKCTKQSGPDVPSIIIANHNADLDPAFVGLGFSRHMYFLSSEHALRTGFASKLLKVVFNPIAFSKSHADVKAIKDMLRRIRAGISVCLFAEGDRSFHGVTGPIPPATAKLVKTSGAQLITFRIEGGYFTTPRWKKSNRKGQMCGSVVGTYPAHELKSMTNEQILDIIKRDKYEDAYARQQEKENPISFKGKDLAEHIETVLYLCPNCMSIGTIKSEGSRFYCACGLEAAYTETGFLEGENLKFSTITQWGSWQTEQLAQIVSQSGDSAICSDENQNLFIVRAAQGIDLIGQGLMSIDRKAFHCAGKSFPIDQITRIIVVGKMTLQFSTHDGVTYEIQSSAPRSALKYKEIFNLLSKSNS